MVDQLIAVKDIHTWFEALPEKKGISHNNWKARGKHRFFWKISIFAKAALKAEIWLCMGYTETNTLND